MTREKANLRSLKGLLREGNYYKLDNNCRKINAAGTLAICGCYCSICLRLILRLYLANNRIAGNAIGAFFRLSFQLLQRVKLSDQNAVPIEIPFRNQISHLAIRFKFGIENGIFSKFPVCGKHHFGIGDRLP